MNTRTLFKYGDRFFSLDQRFIATVKPIMSRAREDYKKLWRDRYYHPAKSPSSFFTDDFRALKRFMGTQKFYVRARNNLYRRDANTAEIKVSVPIYSINPDTKKIQGITTQYKGIFSSEMFNLTPIELFPREYESGLAELEEPIKYLEENGLRKFGFDSEIFKALDGPAAVNSDISTASYSWNMYGSGRPYQIGCDYGREFKDGIAQPYEPPTQV